MKHDMRVCWRWRVVATCSSSVLLLGVVRPLCQRASLACPRETSPVAGLGPSEWTFSCSTCGIHSSSSLHRTSKCDSEFFGDRFLAHPLHSPSPLGAFRARTGKPLRGLLCFSELLLCSCDQVLALLVVIWRLVAWSCSDAYQHLADCTNLLWKLKENFNATSGKDCRLSLFINKG